MSLCLNMIVKNESHIIEDTFNKLLSKIKFDYYIICDTGSTDNTVELIETYFEKINVPGEIHKHQWKNFGHNRTLALQAAYKKSDYLLVFDADDYIEGDFKLPELDLKVHGYMLKFGNDINSYERMCLVNNQIKWKYIGVLHEYISSDECKVTGNVSGNYFVVSGRTSSRNKDPLKYQKDAEILEKGYYESLETGDGLHNRYSYYCANSYLDAGNKESAIEWYKKTLECQGWFDERYNSCLKLYELTGETSYLVESFHHNPRRVEGIFQLVKYYCIQQKYSIAMNYYNFIKNYYEGTWDDLSTKLFSNVQDYTFYLPYYMIIVSEKCKEYSTGVKMYSIIYQHRTITNQWWFNNLFYNLQFFEKEQNYSNLNHHDYITFVESKGIEVTRKNDILKKKDNDNLAMQNSNLAMQNKNMQKTENTNKKFYDIMIYTGFSSVPWNWSYSLTNAMGGSERAIIYLTQLFPKEWKILVTGDIKNETVGNVEYLHRFQLNNSYEFDTIIISRYVSYFTMYSYFQPKKIILMAHDTHFMNNVTGCTKSANELIPVQRIDSVIYLTEWQKNHYQTVSHKELKDVPYKIINNGIQLDLFPKSFNKIPNRFVYTSGSFRGLKRLLELWGDIIEKYPDATLFICSYEEFPKNHEDRMMNIVINNTNSIKHLGKLDQGELYLLMDTAEYWLYPCSFNETSCITAMEMLMSEIICLYYPIAGLTDTMGKYGIQIAYGNEVEKLCSLTLEDKQRLISKGKEYALSCSWESRAKEWIKLIGVKKKMLFCGLSKFPKIVLEDYIDSLQSEYHIVYKDSIEETDHLHFDELVFVHYLPEVEFDYNNLKEKWKQISYLNTEPMNLNPRFSLIKQISEIYPEMKIYDYSSSNIKILTNAGIHNVYHLPYLLNKNENEKLKNLFKTTPKVYDFGIITAATDKTNDIQLLTPPRRNELVRNLMNNGFSVNIINGFGEKRDTELAKCKTILNIHGQFSKIPSTIFENLRCNRLLDAGFRILSETCEYMDTTFCEKYPYLEFKTYNEIMNMKKYDCKVIDAFTFYNELDMLEYRLQTLYGIVDYFIISEATLTHVGKPKEMYFEKFKERPIYEKVKESIVHIIVDDFPYNESNINCHRNEQWKNEKFQRNCLTRGLKQINLNGNDIILVSDVDEIPDPCTLKKIKTGEIELKTVANFEQDFYYYNLESKMDHQWYFAKLFRWQWFLTTNFTLDDIRMKGFHAIPKGGWHLSYFGDSRFISNKIKNFAHQEYNSNEYTEIDAIEHRIKNKIDIYNRNIEIISLKYHENTYLPKNYSFFLKKIVCIKTHTAMGLGNCLFLLAAGVFFAEKYGYRFVMDSSDPYLKYGTANAFNRNQMSEKNYFETIFKEITKCEIGTVKVIHNDYHFNFPEPGNQNVIITGYNQNKSIIEQCEIKKYLHIDPDRIEFLKQKYKFNLNETNVCIGLRLDTDGGFRHSTLSFESYKYIMNQIIYENENVHFFILSDIDPSEFLINNEYTCTIVDESDIDQLYLGTLCSHFILSPSTFHYWIAVLSESKNVYYFEDTDIHTRQLALQNWICVKQQEDLFDYYHQKDQSGFDMYRKQVSVPILKELCLKNEKVVGFNTIGWVKNGFKGLSDFSLFGKNEGFYLKNPNPKRYIFIHSCNTGNLSMLEYLLESVKFILYTKIFIINIGIPINLNFGENIEVTNYSNSINLFEIPTINKVREFAKENPGSYILYLHTKGVSYNFENDYVNDWINMMLYFLTKHETSQLLHRYDTVGCNYLKTKEVKPHWSGNFWWARAGYLKDLPPLDHIKIDKWSSELWLFENNPDFHELHKSSIKNHYLERYPKEKYK